MNAKRILPQLEDLFSYHGEFLVSSSATPSHNHQVNEELLMMEKELACDVYIQRDKEKYL